MSFFFSLFGDHRDLHVLTPSFPTRRSSDLATMPRRSASGANASTRRWPPRGSRLDSTSVSSGSGAIICNIARAAFGAAESMSRKLRSKKQPENRGRKRHGKVFGGGDRKRVV